MCKSFLALCLLLLSGHAVWAQQIHGSDAAKIKLQLEKLNTLGRVLYLAAHPDDENTQLLAYLDNEKHYRTAYLSLTRGDGGQNLVGNEQGPYIGLIRTEELLAARQNDGAEQFFSSALDFGYSKTAKETFKFWGHQRILKDAVWIIRKFRPDVIICRFPEDKRAGHGNHWASAIIAHEAYEMAGDSTKFPEQLKYVDPWQPKRVLWNTYQFGGTNTTDPNQFHIDIGGYNPLLGKSYGEIAADGRSMHKSQGFGTAPNYGHKVAYFKTITGTEPHQNLLDGVNTSWSKITGGKKIGKRITQTIQRFDMDHPEAIIPELFRIKEYISEIGNKYWKKQKIKEINKIILACSGIYLDAYCSNPYIIAGENMKVNMKAVNRSSVSAKLKSLTLLDRNIPLNKKLSTYNLKKDTFQVKVAGNRPISQPYWLKKRHFSGYYQIPDQKLVGLPKNPPKLTAVFHLEIAGNAISVSLPVHYRYVSPVKGEIENRLLVAPPVTANISEEVYIFTSQKPQHIAVQLKSFKKNIRGIAHLKVPAYLEVPNNNISFQLDKKGAEKTIYFTLKPKNEIQSSASDTISVELKVNGKVYKRGIKVMDYGYIPTITVFPPSEAKVASMSLKIQGQQIGYIMGSGDKVPEALRQMGYKVNLLKDNELSADNFKKFDAIVMGIRAYNTRKALKYAQDELMEYVNNGGVLVVQYNKNYGLVDAHPGPYPFDITKKRVTNEFSPVKFLLPDASVFNNPNKITKKDFEGWIQERGLYFVDKVDAHYRAPLAMHDPNEASLDGSLIISDYGKGKFVYTGLAFFRELPAGVPGAYRLFANLLAQ
ncbi:MAG TPA: PIG-L family deacetylase [Chitinophagaceae bacterium]|nr:PIG-L family deacetylase [Chitinophagaceae bacterium]